MVPPLTLCAYMKKGPNLRWSLIQCSGGDEGDRTPDLLTASQALSQLSYAPVRRSTIRELGRRCKDNFGKLSRAPARVRGPAWGRGARDARGARPSGGGRRQRRTPSRLQSGRRPGVSRHETGPSTTFVRHRPTMRPWAIIKPQVDGLRFSLYTGYGRGVGVKRSRWAGFVAEIIPGARPEAFGSGKRSLSDRFPANYTGRWPVAPFPLPFEPLFCTYNANPSASKDFARSHQAAQHH